jgi:hypothetical protein
MIFSLNVIMLIISENMGKYPNILVTHHGYRRGESSNMVCVAWS